MWVAVMLRIVLKQNYSPVYFPIDLQGYKIISIIFMMQPPPLSSIYISIYLSTYLYIYLSIHLSIYLSLFPLNEVP